LNRPKISIITCNFAAMEYPSLILSEADTDLIRSFAAEAELSGKLTPQQLALAFERGWFRALVPAFAGGTELSLPEMMQLLESAGRADGSFGWTLNLGAGANMFAGFLDTDTAIRLFADRFMTIAGSGTVAGTAEKTAEGYLIHGQWRYATGSSHAKFFSVSCVITKNGEAEMQADGTTATRSFLIPKEQVRVIGTWAGFGMKASATRDYSIDNVWIPDELSFNLIEPVAPGTLYRFPFIQLAEALLSVTLIGISLHFMEEVEQVIIGRKQVKQLEELTISRTSMQHARAALYHCVNRVWNKLEAGQDLCPTDLPDISTKARNAAQACRMEAARIYPLAGMDAINTASALNRAWRDLHTASQHTLLSPFS
jgi:alkylation response protein AidB-like acyl-CoA dehydrogenase